MRLLATFFLLSCACTRPAVRPTEIIEAAALKATRCGDVTALWTGKPPDGPGPLWSFIDTLKFRLADGSERKFAPAGNIEPPHTAFELFSPDCSTVALAQDSYGPYHLVPTAELGAYLEGKRAPIVVKPPAASTAQILTEQHWVSPTRFEFFASCCGGVEVFQVDVSAPEKATRVYFAAEAPSGIRRTATGYEVIR